MIFPGMAMCSQTGWKGYYKMGSPAVYDIDVSRPGVSSNWANVSNKLGLNLPRDCSGFIFAGILTPFTPPIPLPNFRALSFGKTNPCNNFTVLSKPQSKIQLHTNNQVYYPEESEGPFGNTRYTFPIKAKNIDSGTIIIEKNGERAEVPFKYEYFTFYF